MDIIRGKDKAYTWFKRVSASLVTEVLSIVKEGETWWYALP